MPNEDEPRCSFTSGFFTCGDVKKSAHHSHSPSCGWEHKPFYGCHPFTPPPPPLCTFVSPNGFKCRGREKSSNHSHNEKCIWKHEPHLSCHSFTPEEVYKHEKVYVHSYIGGNWKHPEMVKHAKDCCVFKETEFYCDCGYYEEKSPD